MKIVTFSLKPSRMRFQAEAYILKTGGFDVKDASTVRAGADTTRIQADTDVKFIVGVALNVQTLN